MSALPVSGFAPLDEAEYKQQATILKALHCAYPVQVDGKDCFVQVVHSRLAGGRVEMDVWLTGSSDVVNPADITVLPRAA